MQKKLTLILKSQEAVQKRRKKGARGSELAVRLSPGYVRSCTHKVLPSWLPKHELNRNNSRQPKWTGRAYAISSLTKNCRKQATVRDGKVVLPREKNSNWLSNTKHQPWKHTYNIILTDYILSRNVYVYTNILVHTVTLLGGKKKSPGRAMVAQGRVVVVPACKAST